MVEQRGSLVRNLVTSVFALLSSGIKTYYHLYICCVHLSYYLFFSFSPELIKCAILVCSAGSIPDTCINSGTDLKYVSIVEKKLFGVPLNTLLENDQKLLPNTKVPLLLQAVSFLDFIHASVPQSLEAFEACDKEGLTSHPLYLRAFFFSPSNSCYLVWKREDLKQRAF